MSLEANKIAGAVLLAGVLTMGAGYTGDILVGGGGHHGHGDDHHAVAYPIVMPEGGAAEEVEEVVEELAPVLPLLASADISAGESAFRRCSACHNVAEGGRNGQGPALWDIVGREIASVDGFSYGGLADVEQELWTYENLNGFLAAPKDWAPGTRMNYRGIDDAQDRANMIAYLRAQAPEEKPLDAFQ